MLFTLSALVIGVAEIRVIQKVSDLEYAEQALARVTTAATGARAFPLLPGAALAGLVVCAMLLRIRRRDVLNRDQQGVAPELPSGTDVQTTAAIPPQERADSQPLAVLDGVTFQVAHARTGRLIWTYRREGIALGFVRDVVRVRSHHDAAQFELRMVDQYARATTLARGEQLVRLALEDRVL
jgi:hypothetical protein